MRCVQAPNRVCQRRPVRDLCTVLQVSKYYLCSNKVQFALTNISIHASHIRAHPYLITSKTPGPEIEILPYKLQSTPSLSTPRLACVNLDRDFCHSILSAYPAGYWREDISRITKYTFYAPGQVLMTMWSHAELREVYRKHGWREADFLTPARAAQPRGSSNSSGKCRLLCSHPQSSPPPPNKTGFTAVKSMQAGRFF